MKPLILASILIVQVFIFAQIISLLPSFEPYPIILQVATSHKEEVIQKEIEPVIIEKECDPIYQMDDQVISLLLSKIQKAGSTVKFQTEEEAKRKQCEFYIIS